MRKRKLSLRLDLSVDSVDLAVTKLLDSSAETQHESYRYSQETNAELLRSLLVGDVAQFNDHQLINYLSIIAKNSLDFRRDRMDSLLLQLLKLKCEVLMKSDSEPLAMSAIGIIELVLQALASWAFHHPSLSATVFASIQQIKCEHKEIFDAVSDPWDRTRNKNNNELVSSDSEAVIIKSSVRSYDAIFQIGSQETQATATATATSAAPIKATEITGNPSNAVLIASCKSLGETIFPLTEEVVKLSTTSIDTIDSIIAVLHAIEVIDNIYDLLDCMYYLPFWKLSDESIIVLLERLLANTTESAIITHSSIRIDLIVVFWNGLLLRLQQLKSSANRNIMRCIQLAYRLSPEVLVMYVFFPLINQTKSEFESEFTNDAIDSNKDLAIYWETLQRTGKEVFYANKNLDILLNSIFFDDQNISMRLLLTSSISSYGKYEVVTILRYLCWNTNAIGFVGLLPSKRLKEWIHKVKSIQKDEDIRLLFNNIVWVSPAFRAISFMLGLGGILSTTTISKLIQSLDTNVQQIERSESNPAKEYWIALSSVLNTIVIKYNNVIKADSIIKQDIKRLLSVMTNSPNRGGTIMPTTVMMCKNALNTLEKLSS